ncbi:MAG: PaaI family thioesterase [Acidimicrobiales bacterium]
MADRGPSTEVADDHSGSLVAVVRRLMAASVTHLTDPAETEELAQRVGEIADQLAAADAPVLTSRYGEASGEGGFDPSSLFTHDYVFGSANPLALPVPVRWEPPEAVAEATFTRLYEGPPDGVHGAVLAATFDQICNVANIGSGVAGFTVELEVAYRALTRIDRPVRFRAEVSSVVERQVITRAEAEQDGKVTASAVGTFRAFA